MATEAQLRYWKRMIGYKQSEETKKKRNAKLKGRIFSKEWREKLSQALIGNKPSEESKRKNREWHLGKKYSTETRKKLSEMRKGDKHWNWKGGNYINNLKHRKSLEYKQWRKAVFERDKYTCVWCGDKQGGNLNADHIKPFAHYPELRLDINNGRTLCVPCHRKTPTYGNPKTVRC